MDDLGGFIVGLLFFFLVVYTIITILPYLLLAAAVIVPSFFLIRHLVRQLRDRYTLGFEAKTALVTYAAFLGLIGALIVYQYDLSWFWIPAIAISVFLVTTPGILGLWADSVLRPSRIAHQEAEGTLNQIQAELARLTDQMDTVRREIQDVESRYADQIRLRDAWSANVDALCLASGQDHRFMLVARGKIEKRIALLSIEEMRKRLNEFVTRTEKVKTESMDYMETGLLQIALLDHQTKGVTQDLMKARKGNLQSLEQKAERLHDVLTKQKQEAARTQEILNGYNNRKIVLG